MDKIFEGLLRSSHEPNVVEHLVDLFLSRCTSSQLIEPVLLSSAVAWCTENESKSSCEYDDAADDSDTSNVTSGKRPSPTRSADGNQGVRPYAHMLGKRVLQKSATISPTEFFIHFGTDQLRTLVPKSICRGSRTIEEDVPLRLECLLLILRLKSSIVNKLSITSENQTEKIGIGTKPAPTINNFNMECLSVAPILWSFVRHRLIDDISTGFSLRRKSPKFPYHKWKSKEVIAKITSEFPLCLKLEPSDTVNYECGVQLSYIAIDWAWCWAGRLISPVIAEDSFVLLDENVSKKEQNPNPKQIGSASASATSGALTFASMLRKCVTIDPNKEYWSIFEHLFEVIIFDFLHSKDNTRIFCATVARERGRLMIPIANVLKGIHNKENQNTNNYQKLIKKLHMIHGTDVVNQGIMHLVLTLEQWPGINDIRRVMNDWSSSFLSSLCTFSS